MTNIEVTVFTNDCGPLTKRLSLDQDGKVKSEALGKMVRGRARRVLLAELADLASLIEKLELNQAFALGAMRPDLGSEVEIATKPELARNPRNGAIARTGENIRYVEGRAAIVLFDHDTKGMPREVAAKIEALGGFWNALASVIPDLCSAARVTRPSTSSGLRRTDTNEALPGSSGVHEHVEVEDGSDAVRFLAAAHDRCWLAGLGWCSVSKSGSLLERSIIDKMVGRGERLVFEAPPIVEPPLVQDAASRKPQVHPGAALDTRRACLPLTASELATKAKLRAAEDQRLGPEAKKVREAYVSEEAQKIMGHRQGMTLGEARLIIEKRCGGILLADCILQWDDEEAMNTVGDVLDRPDLFEGMTLADPIDGDERGKAKVMIGDDGIPFINSFAHGGGVYRLRYDAGTIERRVAAADDKVETFVKVMLAADVDAAEEERLVKSVARQADAGVRVVQRMLKDARAEQSQRRRENARARLRAERSDSRPEMSRPRDDAPLTEEMAKINAAITSAPIEQQLRRNLYGHAVKLRCQPVPDTHAFSIDDKEKAPEQWTIAILREYALTEEIERFIDYIDDESGESVRPPKELVQAYMNRDDQALYILSAIATQPIVLADGEILGRENGFDLARGIQFIIPDEILAALPRREDLSDEAVAAAMRFLTDEWLCDVAADYENKCNIVAAALTVIERSLLPNRPVFFVVAGRRSTGKTTTIIMLITALTGAWPAASAWSPKEDERRKAILSQFMSGVPYILWDNIPRGFKLSCPHIERSCSIAYYADRKLGVSEIVATAATSIHFFTGNNIGPRGDLSSRSLMIRLKTDRPDPENREFTHPHPIAWTEAKRGEIFRALYTILLGNKKLSEPRDAAMKTRFKIWYRLIGSAVEHAAELTGNAIDFEKQFVKQDEDDEDDTALADVLVKIADWAKTLKENMNIEKATFKASDLCEEMKGEFANTPLRDAVRSFFYPDLRDNDRVNAVSLALRLGRHIDEPVRGGGETLILRKLKGDGGANATHAYWIETLAAAARAG